MTRELYDGEPHYVWIITHVTALTSIFFSFVGEFYVFITTYKFYRAWKRGETRVPFDFPRKIPCVISFCDFLFSLHHGIDHMYSLITGRVADGALCQWLGFGSLVGLDSTALWSLTLAMYMLCLVVFGVRPDLDKYFLLVALFGWGLPFLANFITLFTGAIGDAGMYCMVNKKPAVLILKPGTFLFVFFLIALCYVAIGIKLVRHLIKQRSLYRWKRSFDSGQFSSTATQRQPVSSAKIHEVGVRLFAFTLVYMLQFFPVSISVFSAISGGGDGGLALNIIDKILGNGNGWMNALVYSHFVRQDRRLYRDVGSSGPMTVSNSGFKSLDESKQPISKATMD